MGFGSGFRICAKLWGPRVYEVSGSMSPWGPWDVGVCGAVKIFRISNAWALRLMDKRKLSQEAGSREVATVMSLRHIEVVVAASSKP